MGIFGGQPLRWLESRGREEAGTVGPGELSVEKTTRRRDARKGGVEGAGRGGRLRPKSRRPAVTHAIDRCKASE